MQYYYVVISSAFGWVLLLNFFLLIVLAISVGFVYGRVDRSYGQPLTAEECRVSGGVVRSIPGAGGRCAPGEIDLGNVRGLATPSVCCQE